MLLSAVTYGWLYGAAAAMYTSTCGVCSVWIFASLAIELKHKVGIVPKHIQHLPNQLRASILNMLQFCLAADVMEGHCLIAMGVQKILAPEQTLEHIGNIPFCMHPD